MKREFKIIGAVIFATIFLISAPSFGQNKLLEKMLQKAAPEEPTGDEATIKLYSDAARTNEITSIPDGTKMLYFRAYLWKDRTKRGDSPYNPMESEYCFKFKEGNFELKESVSGFNYGDVKGEVDAKSMKHYCEKKDYIDIDVDLIDNQILDYFVRDAKENKKYAFTARLEGECKFPLANGLFEIDLSQGKPKYQELALAANDHLEIPEDLYAHDKKLHTDAARLIKSTYGHEAINIFFYKDWETLSNGYERRIATMFTTKKDGHCYMNYVKTYEQLSNSGWLAPSAVNSLSVSEVKCEKLK